ncbi:MAG TPA: glycosyltransferase family 4 protein [Gammaproteobacteria bacterium]|nr:glycosyltransferase family 4 protein [Gammaproteobacteria bacterium]
MPDKTSTRSLCVAQILPALEEGGVERGTLEIVDALRQHGHRALVISGGGRMVDDLLGRGGEHIQIPVGIKSPLTLRFVPTLRRLLKEQQVDILHARSRLPAWIAYLAWRGMPEAKRPRFVTTVHGLYSVNAYSAIMTRGERVIAVSEAVRSYLRDNYPRLDPERIEVILRGVDDAIFYPDYRPSPTWTARFFKDFPQIEDRFIVTLAGRLSRLKGHEDFLDLIGVLVERGVPVHGLVVGSSIGRERYVDDLEAVIEKREIPVTFTGGRKDLRDIFAVSGTVVSMSRKPESFGRTANEALALGVPVVGYDHGGVGEILGAMFPQGAVPVGDVRAAADVIERIQTNELRVKRPNAFPLSRMLGDTINLYESITANHLID